MNNKYDNMIKKYTQKDLEFLEDYIYEQIPETKRIEMEFNRLFNKINNSQNEEMYKYYDDLNNIKEFIKFINIDSSLIARLSASIIELQIKVGQDVRLFSQLKNYYDEQEYKKFINEHKKRGK